MYSYLLASGCYLGAGLCLFRSLDNIQHAKKSVILGWLLLGVVFHGVLLLPNIITANGLNFSLFNTLSLISLIFACCLVAFSLYRPILSLGVLAVPAALIGVNLGYFGRSSYEPLVSLSPSLQTHILLSFVAYCVLLMATVQAVILKLQIRELKHQTIHRFWVSKLPSLQSMESLLFDMILVGFVILSVAIGLGFVATYDIMAQHIAHKLFFSVLSWVVFGVFIMGHYRQGWRGKRAANFTIYGFVLLAIGFVGSKAVLDLII